MKNSRKQQDYLNIKSILDVYLKNGISEVIDYITHFGKDKTSNNKVVSLLLSAEQDSEIETIICNTVDLLWKHRNPSIKNPIMSVIDVMNRTDCDEIKNILGEQ